MVDVLRAFPLTPPRLPRRILSDMEAEGRVTSPCGPAEGFVGPQFLPTWLSVYCAVLLPTAPLQSHRYQALIPGHNLGTWGSSQPPGFWKLSPVSPAGLGWL